MARQLTTQQLATLSCTTGYSTYTRVQVLRSGTWWNLTDFYSRDWVEEVQWSESMESPAATAQVRLLREVNGMSIAPLVVGSAANTLPGTTTYAPLLQEGRLFTVEVAVMPLGMAPQSAAFTEVFRGEIDEVDSGDQGVSFTGRDYGAARTQDTFIEAEEEYGSTGGTAVETVMQSLLTDNSLSAFTLYTPTSPSWALGKYLQRCEPVAEALRSLAQQLGWEVRYRWRSTGAGTGEWRLTLWSPDRSATVPSWTFGPEAYRSLGQVRTSREDVRNAVEVVYSDRAALDAAGNPERKTVVRLDSSSIAFYARRFSRLAEGATSNINTAAEAGRLAEAFIADLKDRPLGVAVEVLLHPGVQLGDLVQLSANAVHFTGDQALAVHGLSHTVNRAGGSTKLTLQGKPSLGRRLWLDIEQRPHLTAPSPFTGPAAPTNLSTETVLGGFRVRFDPPTVGPAAAEYELHVSTSASFVTSSSTRRVVGKLTEMVVTDLTPGATYYAKVVPRDAKGNRGTASSEVTLVPRYVEPRRLQPRVTYAALPVNSDFEARNDTNAPPDNWTVLSGTWGTYFSMAAEANSGSNAVQLGPTSMSNPELGSDLFVVYPGNRYAMRARYKSSVATGFPALDKYPSVQLRWYSDTSTVISSSGAIPTAVTANTWETVEAVVTAPPTARFARLVLTSQGNASTQTILYDSTSVEIATIPLGATAAASLLNSFTNAAGTFGHAQYYYNANSEVCFMGAVSRASVPAAGTPIFNLLAAYRPSRDRYFPVATDSGFGAALVQTNGNVLYMSGGVGTFGLDGIRFRLDDVG